MNGLQGPDERDAAVLARQRYVDALWLGVALIIGAVLIFWRLGDKSLYIDEAFSYREAVLPIARMLHSVVYGDFHPPLFYLMLHALDRWLHLPPQSYRYFTAPIGLLTIVATWSLTRRWFDGPSAAIAAIVVATEPVLVSEDRLVRMYVIVVALVMLSWWLLAAALDASSWRRTLLWIGYGAVAVVLPYLLYVAAFALLAQGAYAVSRWRSAWPALVCEAIAAAALLIPWGWAIAIQFPNGAFPGAHPEWPQIAREVVLNTPPAPWVSPLFDGAVTAVTFAIIGWACWQARRTPLPFLFIPLALQIVLSAALGKDLVVIRYLAPSVPAFAMAVGVIGGGWIQSGARLAGIALALAVVSVNALAVSNRLLDPFYQTPDWYALEITLAQRERPADAIVFDQGMPYLVLEDSPAVRGHPIAFMSFPYPPEQTVSWIDAQPKNRIWYIENIADFADPHRVVFKHLEGTRPRLYESLRKRAEVADWVYIALYGPRSK